MSLVTTSLGGLKSRLPARSDCWTVFNIILFVVFAWSVRGFLFELPSFSLYFRLWDLLGILSYMFAFALVECVLVTAGLVLTAVVLPSRVFKDGFVYKGFLLVLVSTVAAILFQYYYKIEIFQDLVRNDRSSTWPLFEGLVVALVVLAGLLMVVKNNARFQLSLLKFSEQFRVFAYIYIPLGLTGFVVVVLRNIF